LAAAARGCSRVRCARGLPRIEQASQLLPSAWCLASTSEASSWLACLLGRGPENAVGYFWTDFGPMVYILGSTGIRLKRAGWSGPG